MNPRIREIAQEAKIGGADFDNGVKYYVATEETFNKFVQLLIEEQRQILINNGFDDAAGYL